MGIDWFPLWLSLRVAALATVAAVAIGLWLAYLLANRQFRGKELLDAAVTLPLILPPTVLAYYLLVLAGHASPLGQFYEWIFGSPLMFTWPAAVIAAIIYATPLLVKSARAALESVDRDYERAARTLGASEWRIFWQVSLPLARRSVLAAVVLCFARALCDFGITIMIAGNIPGRTQTLSVAVYEAVQTGNGATARVLVLVISVTAMAILFLANRLAPRRAA
ncbi:MAG: molybdate ABC transporter permease subunit [Bryobacteraceae bacterium]